MDLSKAFDTLDHSILLSRLAYYGIGLDMCNNLLKSYLTDRYQYVDYKSARSPTKSIITGVPQGSILGPLLFLNYINDLPLVSQIFDMIMYADDTALYCNINRNISDQDINAELKKVSDWLCSNKLSLNVKKTKYMVFHTAQRNVTYPILTLNNVIIEQQQFSLSTSAYQFGFKSKASTVRCSTMVVETVQYYLEKGDHSVCVLLLDASKAFDKVSFEKLFEILLRIS